MDIRIVVERIGMVGKRQEVQIIHLGSVVKGLLHRTGTVGKIGMRMELAEIQRVITQIHRRFVGKGHNFAGLSLFHACSGNMGNRFDNNRLIRFRGFLNLDGSRIFLAHTCYVRIRRLCAVCGHGIVDFRPVCGSQDNRLSCFHAGAALGRGLHFQPFDCGFFRIYRHALYFIELEFKLPVRCGAAGIIGAPVTGLGVPLHIVAASGILNVIGAVFQVDDFPVVVDGAQIHAGIAVSQADVLTVLLEAVGAVVIGNDRPDICSGVTGHSAVGTNGNVCSHIVKTGLFR